MANIYKTRDYMMTKIIDGMTDKTKSIKPCKHNAIDNVWTVETTHHISTPRGDER